MCVTPRDSRQVRYFLCHVTSFIAVKDYERSHSLCLASSSAVSIWLILLPGGRTASTSSSSTCVGSALLSTCTVSSRQPTCSVAGNTNRCVHIAPTTTPRRKSTVCDLNTTTSPSTDGPQLSVFDAEARATRRAKKKGWLMSCARIREGSCTAIESLTSLRAHEELSRIIVTRRSWLFSCILHIRCRRRPGAARVQSFLARA